MYSPTKHGSARMEVVIGVPVLWKFLIAWIFESNVYAPLMPLALYEQNSTGRKNLLELYAGLLFSWWLAQKNIQPDAIRWFARERSKCMKEVADSVLADIWQRATLKAIVSHLPIYTTNNIHAWFHIWLNTLISQRSFCPETYNNINLKILKNIIANN